MTIIRKSRPYGPVRMIWKSHWMGPAGVQGYASCTFPTSGGTSGSGRQTHLAFHPFVLPGQGRIVGAGIMLANGATADVFYPRFKFQFYQNDGSLGGPNNLLDASYVPDVINAGITPVTTQYTTILGGAYTSYREVRFQFSSYCVAPYSANEYNIFVAAMTEQAYTGDAVGKVAMQLLYVTQNQGRKWQNSAGTISPNPGEMIWAGSLGTNIDSQAFPSNPQSAAAGSWNGTISGTHAQAQIGLLWQDYNG